jgi:S-adenosylhomocysteine hydrolase
VDNTTKAELAEKMAEIIEERGLCHNIAINDGGQVCLLGAGRLAQGYEATGLSGLQYATLTDLVVMDVDSNTADALGLNNSTEVWLTNDGGTPHFGMKPITKDEAIDLVMTAAKKWRNEP